MQQYEKDYFNKLKLELTLLKVNWNALKSNPPCEKSIHTGFENVFKIIKKWEEKMQNLHFTIRIGRTGKTTKHFYPLFDVCNEGA